MRLSVVRFSGLRRFGWFRRFPWFRRLLCWRTVGGGPAIAGSATFEAHVGTRLYVLAQQLRDAGQVYAQDLGDAGYVLAPKLPVYVFVSTGLAEQVGEIHGIGGLLSGPATGGLARCAAGLPGGRAGPRVVFSALGRVREDLVGLLDLLETFFGCGIVGVGVGMVLAGKPSVRPAHFVPRSRSRHAEHLVVVPGLQALTILSVPSAD